MYLLNKEFITGMVCMMKIKENNEKVSLRILFSVFFLSTLAAVVIRTLQMFKYIDHETGFNNGSDIVSFVLYLVVAVAALCFVIVSYLSKESSEIELHGHKNTFTAVGCIAFALSLIYDWINSFLSSTTATGSSTGSAFKDMMVSGALPLIMQSLFALMSMIFMIILAKDFLKGTDKASKRKYLCLAPLGWCGFRLIHCFVRQISFIKVSDLFLELIMLSFMIMFFQALAQVNSSVYSDGFRWRIPAFGFSAAVIAATLNVARLVYSMVNGAGALNAEHPFCITDLMFSLFAVTLVAGVTGKKAENNENATLKS